MGKVSPLNERLWYRRTFNVPAGWTGQRGRLHFGAVKWDCRVAANGKPVGAHTDGFTAFEYDVTEALVAGRNEVVVAVVNPLHIDQADA